MAKTVENRRMLLKRCTTIGEIPTIAPSTDHTDGTWSATDIYDGELFLNIPDQKIYMRVGSTILLINNEIIPLPVSLTANTITVIPIANRTLHKRAVIEFDMQRGNEEATGKIEINYNSGTVALNISVSLVEITGAIGITQTLGDYDIIADFNLLDNDIIELSISVDNSSPTAITMRYNLKLIYI